MPRSLTSAMREAIQAPETGLVVACLLTLEHPSFAAPIRLNDSGADITRAGMLFQQFPFTYSLPDEADDKPPRLTLTVCNVDLQIGTAIREVSGDPITVTLELIDADDPETVQISPMVFKLRETASDALTVSGTLQFADPFNDPFPVDSMSRSILPGIR